MCFSWLFGRKKDKEQSKKEHKENKEIGESVKRAFEQVRHSIIRRPDMAREIEKLYKKALVMFKNSFHKLSKEDRDIINAQKQEIKRLFKEADKKVKEAKEKLKKQK